MAGRMDLNRTPYIVLFSVLSRTISVPLDQFAPKRRDPIWFSHIDFLQVTRSTRVISTFSFMQFTGKQYFWRVYGSVCICADATTYE